MKRIDAFQYKLYRMLNDMDDRRERAKTAAAKGRHEPSSMYDGLYDIEAIDQGGDLVERRERGIGAAFVPVSELPHETEHDDEDLDLASKPIERAPARPIIRRNGRPLVLRRRATLQAAL